MYLEKQKGFTLIELLVVIAIIGILSTVILASLSSARTKGRIAGMQSALRSLVPHIVMCLNDGKNLVAEAAGTAICTGSSAVFPTLETDWSYTSSVDNSIIATGDGVTITCTEGGCVQVTN